MRKEMKYRCEICNSDMCFDGTTDETIRYDVACHEVGDNHVRNLESIILRKKCTHYMLRKIDDNGNYQCGSCFASGCDKIFNVILGERKYKDDGKSDFVSVNK